MNRLADTRLMPVNWPEPMNWPMPLDWPMPMIWLMPANFWQMPVDSSMPMNWPRPSHWPIPPALAKPMAGSCQSRQASQGSVKPPTPPDRAPAAVSASEDQGILNSRQPNLLNLLPLTRPTLRLPSAGGPQFQHKCYVRKHAKLGV